MASIGILLIGSASGCGPIDQLRAWIISKQLVKALGGFEACPAVALGLVRERRPGCTRN